MIPSAQSVLLLGESGVGKTHFGAQLLKRLLNSNGRFRMNGAATNLEPFEATMECLNDGRSAAHTPTSTYLDSVWPVADTDGQELTLVWPDYGGEQVKKILDTRRVPTEWRDRVMKTSAWILMLRLHQLRVSDDLLSKPVSSLASTAAVEESQVDLLKLSDQARMIELLQVLLYLRGGGIGQVEDIPQLCILLSCWDELGQTGTPASILSTQLPMLSQFVLANWASPMILGLSALERPLDKQIPDEDYVTRGPEQFGYIIAADGTTTTDLTIPLDVLISTSK
jgi:hypothetical protein